MHALVTGGGGFLGRYIVEALVARGDAVRSFSRRPYGELEALGVEQLQGDLRDAAAGSHRYGPRPSIIARGISNR